MRSEHNLIVGLFMAIVGLHATQANASEVRTSSRTIAEAYVVHAPGLDGPLITRRRLVQYVQLGVYDILAPKYLNEYRRAPEDGQIQVISSLRLRHDFGTWLREAGIQSRPLVAALDEHQIDIQYGYIEGKNLAKFIDFRVGRQFDNTGLDWYAFDGGWLKLRSPAYVALEAFGGAQTRRSNPFGYPFFEFDGEGESTRQSKLTAMVGAALSLTDVSWADAKIAYRRSSSRGKISADGQQAGVELAWPDAVEQEVVSATSQLRLFDNHLRPYAALRYNLGTVQLDDVSAGIDWYFTGIHVFRVQYLRSIPTFDLDSIFNLFTPYSFDDLRVRYEIRPSPQLTLAAYGQSRFTLPPQLPSQKNSDYISDDIGQVNWGGGARAAWQTPRFSLMGEVFSNGGDMGLLTGSSLSSRVHFIGDRIALDMKLYGLYDRSRLPDRSDGYSFAAQLGVDAMLWKGLHATFVAEEMTATRLKHSFRMFMILSMDWTFRVGQR